MWTLNKAGKKWLLGCLPPPRRIELANFRIEKNVNISQSWCKSKKSMRTVKFMYTTPNQKIQNHRELPYKLCLEKACLLCSLPSSALVMASLFSLGSPIVDIHMVKTRPGTGVPRSPESNAPISSLYAPHHFPRNKPVLATYSGQYFLSFSLSFLLPPPPSPAWAS